MMKKLNNLLAALPLVFTLTSMHASAVSLPPMQRAGAKPTMTLGDGTIHTDKLQAYSNAWLVTIRKKDGTVITGKTIWTETLRIRELDGRKVFWWESGAYDYHTVGPGLFNVNDKSTLHVYYNLDVFDMKALVPIWSWHHFSDHDVLRVAADGTHIKWGHAPADDGPWETHNFDMPAPAYDLEGGFFAVLAPLVDLRVGNSGVIPGIGDKDTPVKGYPFRVVRNEKIHAGYYGLAETTVVEIYEPRSDELFTFWVIDKPPYVLRFTVPGDDYDQDFEELGNDSQPINWNNYGR